MSGSNYWSPCIINMLGCNVALYNPKIEIPWSRKCPDIVTTLYRQKLLVMSLSSILFFTIGKLMGFNLNPLSSMFDILKLAKHKPHQYECTAKLQVNQDKSVHLVMVPNGTFSDLENQDTLIIRTLMISIKVSIIHSFHCNPEAHYVCYTLY